MKILIVYDSVSTMKLTAKVGETIGLTLKEKGFEVDSFFVKDVDSAAVKTYDCVVAGAPTMAFRVSTDIRKLLEGLPSEGLSGKSAAAFDTQIQSRLSGSAAKGIESKLRSLGFRLVIAPLIAYVEGKANEMRLKEGELDKAEKWAKALAEALTK